MSIAEAGEGEREIDTHTQHEDRRVSTQVWDKTENSAGRVTKRSTVLYKLSLSDLQLMFYSQK